MFLSNSLRTALRYSLKNKNQTIVKILSLGVGFSFGLLLIAKICFEQTFDDFFPDAERIYQIRGWSFLDDEAAGENEPLEMSDVSGFIAPGMKAEVPGVDAATRFTYITENATFTTQDNRTYQGGKVIAADSCLFDLFPRNILSGQPEKILSQPMSAMISSELAETMGGVEKITGQTIELSSRPGKKLRIEGVFGKLPHNTHLNYDIIVSMPSIGQFTWDGSSNWIGNERYQSYIRLAPGVSPGSLDAAIRKMQEKHQPLSDIYNEKQEPTYGYYVTPLREIHSGTPEVKRKSALLFILALALLFTGVTNYTLLLLSSLANRIKEVVVKKCFGASTRSMYAWVCWQTQFPYKVPFAPFLFLACDVFVFSIINLIVTANCFHISAENPVVSLKSE